MVSEEINAVLFFSLSCNILVWITAGKSTLAHYVSNFKFANHTDLWVRRQFFPTLKDPHFFLPKLATFFPGMLFAPEIVGIFSDPILPAFFFRPEIADIFF